MEQLELNLQQAKQEIKEEMKKTAQSFVVIGYRLRQILDTGAYMQDGYNDFNEFALKEFGLSQSGTSRFISINKNYSEGGYGPVLREEYTGYSCSQLSEMLSLSVNDRSMVTEDMPVAQIREVKTFVRDEDRIGGQVAMDFGATVSSKDLYLEMFKNHTEELRHLLVDDVDEKEVCEIMCPSGSRVFRYKTIMIIMHDISKGVVVRVFGGNQETFTYQMMLQDIRLNVSVEDIVDATSHIEAPAREEKAKKEESKEEKNAAVEKASKEEPEKEERDETKDEEKDIALDSADHHVGESELETGETGQEDQDDRNEDVPVEKVEGEVVDSEPVMQQDAPVQQAIDANTMRGYKSAMRSQIRQLGVCIEDENWERMKRIAEDIVWRANKIITMEDGGWRMSRPILFNTDMVRAILSGRKTVTRRVVKHDVDALLNSPFHKAYPEVEDKQIISKLCMPPYQSGDILYVRETWCDDRQFTHDSTPGRYFYKESEKDDFTQKWRPSIHMPKDAARIWLKVKDVRVERLSDITPQEAWKEGARCSCMSPVPDCAGNKTTFIDIWNSTIKKSDLDRYGWDANPWVWVIEFERCECQKH